MNPRFALYDGSVVAMFPRKLMNTARSATLLSASEQARLILNILPSGKKAGSGSKRYGVAKKGNALGGSVVIRDIMEYRTSAGAIRFLAYVSDGSIRVLNETTGAWTSLVSGLTTGGNPRWVAFNEKLIIADGVNPLMAYNGSTVEAVKEWVVDFENGGSSGLATAANQVDTSTITVDVGDGRSDYAVGKRVRVTFQTAGEVIATISGVSGSSTVTIDVDGTPFPSPSETIEMVEYEYTAPAFSDIYAEHNRLWALSAGETKAKDWRSRVDGMKVFYTDATNNEASWVNPDTQELGYVNLLNRVRRFDELMRISSFDGYMVFFSRQNTILFAGDDPTEIGEFTWVKTIPVGCVNGNLVQKYPSDVLFFTRYGARSLRTVFSTEGHEVVPDLGSDVDPTVTDFVSTMVGSDARFKNARSFFYERDGFYGFNFGATYVMVYALSEESKGWVFFDGIFKDASAYLGTSDGRLLLAKDDQLYAYANGSDSDAGISYADDGSAILMKWWTPWMQPRRGRWSNVGFEVMMEETSATTLTLVRMLDWIESRQLTAAVFNLQEEGALWDEDYWDEGYWDGTQKRNVIRDKFLADSFALILENSSTAGPISILGLKPVGK
jgi:hypothetical protein